MAVFIENVSRLWNRFPAYNQSFFQRGPPSPHILSTSPPDHCMELYVLDYHLIVCTVPRDAIADLMHPIVKNAILSQARSKFFSFTETNEDYTIITTEDLYQELEHHQRLGRCEHRWRALTVSAGALGAAELVGVSKIANSVIGPLADNEISVLCMSTYQSDYILIQEPDYENAINCLNRHFKIFNENHEKIGGCNKSVTTSTQLSEEVGARPVVHPFVSPPNKFHITGLHSSLLPSVTYVLLQLMFYPELQVEGDGPDGNEKDERFFHFSVVNDDISFVLSPAALQKFPSNTLYTSTNEETWRMIKIGDSPLGFDIHGVVAQISEPIADARISTYYISTFKFGHALVPDAHIESVLELLEKRRQARQNGDCH